MAAKGDQTEREGSEDGRAIILYPNSKFACLRPPAKLHGGRRTVSMYKRINVKISNQSTLATPFVIMRGFAFPCNTGTWHAPRTLQ
jgi:hypothetical protein